VLAHVGEEPHVERAGEVHLVGDLGLVDHELLRRPLAEDLVLAGAILGVLAAHLQHDSAKGQPRRVRGGEGGRANLAGRRQQAAGQRADDRERAVHVDGEPREPVALRIQETKGFTQRPEPRRPAELDRGLDAPAEERGVEGRGRAAGPQAHGLVLWIREPGRDHLTSPIHEAQRPARLEARGSAQLVDA
jgi:hypothetical protein